MGPGEVIKARINNSPPYITTHSYNHFFANWRNFLNTHCYGFITVCSDNFYGSWSNSASSKPAYNSGRFSPSMENYSTTQ